MCPICYVAKWKRKKEFKKKMTILMNRAIIAGAFWLLWIAANPSAYKG